MKNPFSSCAVLRNCLPFGLQRSIRLLVHKTETPLWLMIIKGSPPFPTLVFLSPEEHCAGPRTHFFRIPLSSLRPLFSCRRLHLPSNLRLHLHESLAHHQQVIEVCFGRISHLGQPDVLVLVLLVVHVEFVRKFQHLLGDACTFGRWWRLLLGFSERTFLGRGAVAGAVRRHTISAWGTVVIVLRLAVVSVLVVVIFVEV
jgi:hypothetical protein